MKKQEKQSRAASNCLRTCEAYLHLDVGQTAEASAADGQAGERVERQVTGSPHLELTSQNKAMQISISQGDDVGCRPVTR